MASTRSIVTAAFRWATFPLVVIVGLNIQNRATEAGYSRVSLRALFQSKDMTDLYNEVTSDWVWGAALFFAGVVVSSWLYYWLEQSEGKQGSWARTSLAGMCENAAKWLERPGINRWLSKPRRFIPMLNKRLIAFGFEPIPDFDPKNEERNKRSARYLRAIQGPIKSGD